MIRKAERKKAKLRLGIAAPSGAGKTMGALLVAFGITGDWSKVGIIDTEAGSGELYVGATAKTDAGPVVIGDYLYSRLDPDYTAAKYIAALKEFDAHGVGVVIIDSLSHAWAGTGGLLDKQNVIAAREKNSYTAWRQVTPDHNKLVETMLGLNCHLIATMRSKQEYVLTTNDKGKQVPQKVGMAPVQREGMEYEFTTFFDIDSSHVASASKDRTNIFDGQFFKLSPKTGETMLDWLEFGKEPEKDLKQLITEFVQAMDIAPDLAIFEKCVLDNATLTGRAAKENPEGHKWLLGKIEARRKALNNEICD